MHLMYKKARGKTERKEQRLGERSVAADLRALHVAARERAQEEREVKERLRALRRELEETVAEVEQPELFDEGDAAQVLDEAGAELESMLVVPPGMIIRSEAPSEEALTFSKPASAASQILVGCQIAQKWEGDGWCHGTISSVNVDARFSIGGDKVNFFVHYDGEDEPSAHVLRKSAYNTNNNADYDCWMLFEKAAEVREEPTLALMQAELADQY